MLDNEPTGGSVVGESPAADTADTTNTVQKPARRRATRKAAPPAPVEQAGAEAAPTPAPTPEATPSPEAAPAADGAPAAEAAPAKAPAKRASRARKKAAPAAVPEADTVAGAVDAPAADASAADVAPAGAAEGAPPAKKAAKRTARSRKKAAAPAEQPSESVAGGVTAVTDATVPVKEDAPIEEDAPVGSTSAPTMAAPPPVVMFMAPDPVTPVVAKAPVASPFTAPESEETPAPTKRSRSRRKPAVAEPEPAAEETEPPADEAEGETAEDEESAERRRRRRGRRGRGRGRGTDDVEGDESPEEPADEQADADADTVSDEDTDTDGDDDAEGTGTRRRRRRRRRGSSGTDAEPDDPPNTVVKVRETRSSFDDEVQGVKGSTRLEAKRQRRRDGRDQGRRRPPVLSEAEFLARREAVERVMVVRQQGERTQIAVLEDDVLVEHYVTKASSSSYAGNVYLGKVQNVLPSMEAAFVDIGKGRNAVLYAGEVNWDSAGMAGKPRKIEQALKSGDPVLVQVTKDPIGHKGARLTSQISLPGRFLVYVPEGQMTGISRKLPENERKRLKDILKKIVPENAGVIIRTAAEGASEEELSRDVARLEAQWQSIKAKSEKGGAPALLHAEPDLVIRVIRDIFNEDFSKLVVQGTEAWNTVEEYVAHVSPDLVERLSRHTGESDIFHDLRIDEQIAKALDRKVWLPSGGSLVIDRTEAMTVVDVNTGKFTGQGGNLEETVTRNNLEAAEEIVRQLRLRDIGGIIVIDFIDMVLEGNRDLVLRRLTECLGRDRTKHQVAEVTSLGLVQMTRKRVGQGLLEVFSETCEHCRGRGIIVRTEPVGDRPKPAQPVAAAAAAEPKSRRRRGRGKGGESEPTEVAEPVLGPDVVATAIANGSPADEEPEVEAIVEEQPTDAELEAIKGEPAKGEPAKGEPAKGEPAKGEPAKGDVDGPAPEVAQAAPSLNGAVPAGREPAADDPAADEPVAVEPVAVEPSPVESVPAPRKRSRRAASRPAGPPAAAS